MRRKSKQVHANAMGMTDGESSTAQQLNAELMETRRRLAALQEEARRLGVELVAATERADRERGRFEVEAELLQHARSERDAANARADRAEATVEAVDEERKAVLRRAEGAEESGVTVALTLAEVTRERDVREGQMDRLEADWVKSQARLARAVELLVEVDCRYTDTAVPDDWDTRREAFLAKSAPATEPRGCHRRPECVLPDDHTGHCAGHDGRSMSEIAPDAQEPESQHHPEPVELKPGVYRHYKGMLYRVYGTARDSTDGPLEGRTMVRYSSMRTGDSHVRELGQFLRTLPNGKQRFTWERP